MGKYCVTLEENGGRCVTRLHVHQCPDPETAKRRARWFRPGGEVIKVEGPND